MDFQVNYAALDAAAADINTGGAQVVSEILKSLVNLGGVFLPLSHQRSELHRRIALPGAADGRQVALETLEVAVDVGLGGLNRRETLL